MSVRVVVAVVWWMPTLWFGKETIPITLVDHEIMTSLELEGGRIMQSNNISGTTVLQMCLLWLHWWWWRCTCLIFPGISHPWKYSGSDWTRFWAIWSSWRSPCSLQGGWAKWPLKVLSKPNYSMILWYLWEIKPCLQLGETSWVSLHSLQEHCWYVLLTFVVCSSFLCLHMRGGARARQRVW